jgi:hypothetical protein
MTTQFIDILHTWGNDEQIVQLTTSTGQILTGTIYVASDNSYVMITGPAVRADSSDPNHPGRWRKVWRLANTVDETFLRLDAIVGVRLLGENPT